MAEKNQNQYHPPAANGYSRSGGDAELSSLLEAGEARRKKRIKWAAYGAAFVVFQTIVIVVFVMVVMKVRRPKFRLGDDVDVLTWPSNTSSFGITTTGLSSELSSGSLTLSGQGRMEGKAEIMIIFKKKKATDMNCTMVFNVSAKKIASVKCE
ncbi:hypothetical protein SAY86_013276 [Trapa natans]|uniref:Late embryogenesis abundant protein LEA-2 subgroup domain-containing protein n=1 Tax=Trapa natans TaxID=22666 RepID=A0AAN7LZG9_TRANT|nr:hypothetical protein SAY86_013276 [Trapa natans]